jgi:hypothetical protein
VEFFETSTVADLLHVASVAALAIEAEVVINATHKT